LREMYKEIIGFMVFVMGFITMYLIVFTNDIIRITLQRGAFDQLSADLTSGPLIILSAGIALNSMYVFQMRFYYAQSNYKKLLFIRFIMFVAKLLLSYLLVFSYKQNGLALATVLAWVIGFVLMNHDLCKFLGINAKNLYSTKLFRNLLLVLASGLLFTAADFCWGKPVGFIPVAVKLSIMGVGGAIIYYHVALKLNFPEAFRIKYTILKRIFR
jgi:putative peptidoglycan lipid II flippase